MSPVWAKFHLKLLCGVQNSWNILSLTPEPKRHCFPLFYGNLIFEKKKFLHRKSNQDCNGWPLPDDYLRTGLPDDCLTTDWRMPDDYLRTAWWMPDDCLTTTWQLPDCLTTVWQWQLPDDWLLTAWYLVYDWIISIESVLFLKMTTLDSGINIGVRLLIFEKKNWTKKMKHDRNALFDVKMN